MLLPLFLVLLLPESLPYALSFTPSLSAVNHWAEPPVIADAADVARLCRPYGPIRSHQHYPQLDRWGGANSPGHTYLCSRATPASADRYLSVSLYLVLSRALSFPHGAWRMRETRGAPRRPRPEPTARDINRDRRGAPSPSSGDSSGNAVAC